MSSLIRVAIITSYYYPLLGGIPTHLTAITSELQNKGVEVHVITKRASNLLSFEKISGVFVHRLSTPGSRPIASITFILKCLYCLRQLQPDIIHAHELLLPTTTAIVGNYLFNIPVVATAHSSGPLIGEVARVKRAFLGKYRLKLFRQKIDVFVANSNIIDQELESAGIPAQKRAFIPNGIDMKRFAPVTIDYRAALRQKLNLPDAPITVFTGRLASEKRVQHLLHIWPSIRQIYPEALLLIIGSGPEEIKLQETSLAGVKFIGNIADVSPYLQVADLFVLPSVAEGFSISTLEALATGLPVIATNVGAIPDFISHGDNGWIIPPDDVTALQESVISLLGDPTLRINMGRRARKRVIEQYSLDATANQLFAVYSQLASKQRNENTPIAVS